MRERIALIRDLHLRLKAGFRLAVVLVVAFSFSLASLHIHADYADQQLLGNNAHVHHDHDHDVQEYPDHGSEDECSFCLTVAGKKWTPTIAPNPTHFLNLRPLRLSEAVEETYVTRALNVAFAPRAPPMTTSFG